MYDGKHILDRWLFCEKHGKCSVLDKVPSPPFIPLSSYVLSFHLLFMKEFYWFWRNIFEIVRVASGCRASIETEECEWGCSIWIQIEDEKSSVPLFSRRRIRNSICFYDFSCSAPPMHYPTLDVKSHLRKEVSSPQSALLFCCLKAHSSKVWLLC